jgi:hypothetical protein
MNHASLRRPLGIASFAAALPTLLAIVLLSLTATLAVGAGSASAEEEVVVTATRLPGPSIPQPSPHTPDPDDPRCVPDAFTMEDPSVYCQTNTGPEPPPSSPHAPLPGPEDRERLMIAATNTALDVLETNTACFNHLSPVDNDRRDGNLNPVTVMSSVRIDFFDDGSNDFAAAPFKKGTSGFVALLPNFYRPLTDPLNYPWSFVAPESYLDLSKITLTRSISESETRVLIVLHEIGHLTGENARHTASDLGQGFNNGIMVHCLGAAQFR